MFRISKNVSIGVGSFSLIIFAYLYYVKRCYSYLKSYGFDSPPPKFFFGNLLSFVALSNESNESNKQSHYSKTLYNWTKTYGKIYGYYEGHSPVLVIADPDLVTEIFVNQSKLVSFRRTFPMSKKSNDPNADIFTTNGIRWVRIRYGLEKVILNTKNQSKCLQYADECFINTFIKHSILDKLNEDFNIVDNVRMMMVQTMFSIIFGDDLKHFFRQELKQVNIVKKPQYKDNERLAIANHVANKFSEAFEDFEKFSLLKFVALMIPELEFIWRLLARFKVIFNSHIFRISYFADPMDWFYINFIEKYLMKYALENNLDPSNSLFKLNEDQRRSRLQSFNNFKTDDKKFSFFNTFLYLTHNRIIKYNPNEINISNRTNNRMETIKENSTYIKRGSFSSRNGSSSDIPKIRSLSSSFQPPYAKDKTRHYSTDLRSDEEPKSIRRLSRKSSSQMKIDETESEDFENWRLTLNEALNNSLLMFFAGYETTSSAISFSVKIISSLPEQRDKLIDEIKEYWNELSVNINKFTIKKKKTKNSSNSYSLSSSEHSETDDEKYDEVFEEESEETGGNRKNDNDKWNDFCDTLEKMKYLDMFVREVMRMFPIANSMVSRKCVVDNLTIDNGNYYIPKNMNIVVDVLSIHYDKTIWGPVDPEIFYPERFLTERNPSAWLPFGTGSRKCIAQKLAMSKIKLVIIRLLQNYVLDKAKSQNEFKKITELIQTKDILFNAPIGGVYVSIDRKNLIARDK